MRLLIVAADRMEFRGILARAEQPRRARLDIRWCRFARLNGHEVLLAANGMGWARAAAAVDAAVPGFRPDAVVTTGFCGALDDGLQKTEPGETADGAREQAGAMG